MKLRQLRGLAAVTIAASLALTACSSDDKETESTPSSTETSAEAAEVTKTTEADAKLLEGITFTHEAAGKAPTDIKVDKSVNDVSNYSAVVATEGTGDALADGDTLTVHYVATDLSGAVQQSTYESGSTTNLVLSADQTIPQIVAALEGQKVGAVVKYVVPGTPATEATDETEATEAVDATVMILEITGKLPNRAWGEDQKVTDTDIPSVTLDDSGKPSISLPDGYKGVDKLKVVTLKKGDGAKVEATSVVTAHYTGWNLTGEQFDSSWDRNASSSFSLEQVIAGWTDGLTGQTVGSQVLLVIPGDQAYGEGEGTNDSGQPLGDLIFVVDILAIG